MRRTGVGSQTLMYAVRAGGISLRRPTRRRVDPARVVQAAALRQAGVPYRAIARRLGCHSRLVNYLLMRDAPPLAESCARCGAPARARHHVSYHPVPVVVSVCPACHSHYHRVPGEEG